MQDTSITPIATAALLRYTVVMSLKPVIGLEVHLALNTASKIFSWTQNDNFGAAPNHVTDPVSLGLPGSLPTLNQLAVDKAITFALALGCAVPEQTQFHRKHYFYPDLPKNYQISQYDKPIGEKGFIQLAETRRIGITRCHLEEDPGRSQHPTYADYSLVDFNRSGQPLIEMVSEPEIGGAEEARHFLVKVQAIAQALNISEANPETGKMRADVNISLHHEGEPLGTKVEIKNLNSFKAVQSAIEFEIKRQSRLLEQGIAIQQETRGWDDGGQKTFLMRTKEGEADYRYMPEPDIPPLHIDEAWLRRLREAMPELPDAKLARYISLGMREYDAQIIAYDIALANFFDAVLALATGVEVQNLANWLNSDVVGWLKAEGLSIQASQLSPAHFAALMQLVQDESISGRSAKDILPEVMQGADPVALVEARGLKQISDDSVLEQLISRVMQDNPNIVSQAKENPKAINALLGRVMKASGGQAKAATVRAMLATKLHE